MPIAPKTVRSTERKREREQFRGSKQSRGYGGEWERISKIKRAECPVCEVCHDAVAVDVDHVIPFDGLDDPLRTDWNNLRSICRRCHNDKTHGKMG
jgi:5-methylcytosine-specific restriction endonuclease McrA